MRDDEISASIARLLLRHPITDDDELSGFDLPLSPSLLKTLLLRRLGSLLSSSSDDPFDETLDTLELVAELDRDHALSAPPPPSLQRAYCALAVDATARWLKRGDWGGFLDAVERNWRARVRDLAASEAKGLASEGLGREMMVMVEAAAGNGDVIEELRRRDTSKEAYEAAVAYFKEAVGPTIGRLLEEAAAAAAVEDHDDDRGVVGGEREGGEDAAATAAGEHDQAVIVEEGEAATAVVGGEEEGHQGQSIIVDAGDLRDFLDGVDSLQVMGEEGNGVSTNEEGGCSKDIRGKKKNAIEEVRDGNNVNEESMSSSPNLSNDLHTRVKRKASVDAMKNIMGSNKKRKFWKTDEEDVMRKAVSEYGEGKWKQIKNSYPGIFGERSPIDLKDKWRNMKAKVN